MVKKRKDKHTKTVYKIQHRQQKTPVKQTPPKTVMISGAPEDVCRSCSRTVFGLFACFKYSFYRPVVRENQRSDL